MVLGFTAKGVKGNQEAFFSEFPLLAIAHVIVDGNLMHYVVIHKISKRRIILFFSPYKLLTNNLYGGFFMQEMPKAKNHTVMLDNRGKLVMTGTEDVSGFNEETVSVKTSCGCLVIKGENLHIDKLNLETGDVSIDGKINAMQYLGNGASKSKLSKLFK